MEGYHRPVLLREVIEALDVRDGGWYLDCTLGDGGHSLEILKLGGRVVGIDVDPQALERARGRLGNLGYLGKVKLIQGNFRDLKNLIETQTEPVRMRFEGTVFDLGVSSLQLESPERGFSFSKEGPLDMRMDPELQVKALDLVNGLNRGELYELFNKLGEEKNSRALADALVSARQVGYRGQGVGIRTTKDLVDLVEDTYRRIGIRKWKIQIHPATRVFQALRIAVNDELNALKEALPQVLEVIDKNGHIVVISFHSLEDRIVKNTYRDWQDQGMGNVLTKKPIVPSDEEIKNNPRARSAKMRVFQKI